MILSAAFLFRLYKLKNALLADARRARVTLDDNWIILNKENAQEVRFGWDNVLFVRVLREGIYFVASEQTGMMISVCRRYQKLILPWLRENRPEIEIITGK